MLTGQEQTAGKFANVELLRNACYARLTQTGSARSISEWAPLAWELIGKSPAVRRAMTVPRIPPFALQRKHHLHVFARPPGQPKSKLLFSTAMINMGLQNRIPMSMVRERWSFAAVALPSKLTAEGIALFESRHRHLLNYARVGEDKRLRNPHALEVMFPCEVARAMMRTARKHRDTVHVLSVGHTPESIRSMEHSKTETSLPKKYREFQLASTIQRMASDSKLSDDLADALASGTTGKVSSLVTAKEYEILRHAEMAERITAECVAWLDSELFEAILEHSELGHEGTYDIIDELDHILPFLSETATGTARLAAYARKKLPHSFIQKGFVEVPPQMTPVWARVRLKMKVAFNIISLLNKSDAALSHASVKPKVTHLGLWMSSLFADRTIDFRPSVETVKFSQSRLVGATDKAFTKLEGEFEKIVLDDDTLKELRSAIKNLQPHLDSLLLAIDTVNVGFAIGAIVNAAANDQDMLLSSSLTAGSLLLSVVGRVLADDIKALGPGLSRASVTGLANLGAVWFAYKNLVAANAAGKVGDHDAQWVMYAAATAEIGGLVMAMAAAYAAEGTVVASIGGPVGAILGVIGGVCYLIYDSVRDSELNSALQYSVYGSLDERKLPDSVDWCPVTPTAMRGSAEASLIGIDYGLRQYTVTTEERSSDVRLKTIFLPRIIVGHIDERTRFDIAWDITTRDQDGKTLHLEKVDIWTPFGDLDVDKFHKGSQRSFANRLQANGLGEMFFDAEAPEGFAAFAGPSFSGTVRIRKWFSCLGKNKPIPFNGPITLDINTTMTTRLGSRRIRSSSFSPKKP